MEKLLMDKYEKVRGHYNRLKYEYEEGLIPPDLYLQELTVINNYLDNIHKKLEERLQVLKGEI